MNSRDGNKSLLLTFTLLSVSFLVFLLSSFSLNVYPIILLVIIEIGYILAIVDGIKSNDRSVRFFSIVVNSILLLGTAFIIFLLLIPNGVSEH